MVRCTSAPVTPPPRGFACPFSAGLLAEPTEFAWPGVADAAADRYRCCRSAAAREHVAGRLYLHHLPVVAGSLSRYCAGTACEPSRCPVRELVGETYPIFLSALDSYRSGGPVSFADHLRRELDRGLRRCVERMSIEDRAVVAPEARSQIDAREAEATLLEGRFTEELLGRLEREEVELVLGRALGRTIRELAESRGVSQAAIRRRLRRARRHLRAAAGSDVTM